jgi:PEP-CTERM motif
MIRFRVRKAAASGWDRFRAEHRQPETHISTVLKQDINNSCGRSVRLANSLHKFWGRNIMKSLILSAALALSPATAWAATIFDTGIPSGPAGYSIYNEGPTNNNAVAARFTLTAMTQITSVEGWFGSSAGGQDQVIISLHNAAPGVGSVIASENATVPDYRQSGNSWVGAFTAGAVTLGAGDYWVSFTVDPNAANRCNCWMPADNNVTIPQGAYRNTFTGTNWLERELYFGLRITGNAAGAVPEPASWTMLIAGFGLAGMGLRRTRQAPAPVIA